MNLRCILSIPAIIASTLLAESSTVAQPTISLQELLRQMDAHDHARAESLKGYTCLRRYSLENHRFHKKAELNVRMTYTAPGHKIFEVLSEKGAAVLRQRVLRPMLDAEEEAGRDDIRPRTRMVEANYNFKLLGEEPRQGHAAYLLQVTPKTRNKFLIRGKVWVDAKDFGIIRVEASPAQSPSVLIYNTRVIQESICYRDVWLPLFNHSNTDSFLFGHTEVSIDSWDYKMAADSN
jgi:outer membrane lipoprotein-sorting protein